MAQMVAPEADVELKRIKSPTLIIWGDKENIFPRSEQDLLVAALRNAVLKVYPDTGHAPNWERPERVVKDLHEFID
jgi:rifampin ADP-ribosylating transferase